MEPITITDDNFKQEVLEAKEPVLIDFWAAWCGPCKMMSPVVDEIAGEVSGIKVGKVNVDDNQELAQKFNVMSIPTLILFKGGKPTKHSVGVVPKDVILDLLK
ncbi:MAG: thioredoxin [Schwartzia sp.]|nr:thioredoxin [Schwartzia sp. (in: firmicutes)]